MQKRLLLIFLTLTTTLSAQDIHFSQYSFSPLTVSPAFTGLMEGNNRLNIKHRNQWRSVVREQAYQTIGASYDFKVCNNKNPFGFGFNLLADRAGVHHFTNLQGSFSMAYHQKIGKVHYLAAGAQIGMNQYRFSDGNWRFDEQFDGFDFDPTLPSFEEFDRLTTNLMPDINIGFMYYNTRSNINGGLALYHVNQPDYSFKEANLATDSRVNMRMVGHLSAPLPGQRLIFKNLLMIQRPITEFHHWQNMVGMEWQAIRSRLAAAGRKSGAGRSRFLMGLALRITDHNNPEKFWVADAAIVTGRLDLNKLAFGIAYDINVSPLRSASTFRGGFEFSMQYKFNDRFDCVDCYSFL